MENKKVRNATPKEVDGIKFKSTLEADMYEKFKELGIDVKYEEKTFTLLDSFRSPQIFYNRSSKGFKADFRPVRQITHTPDFTYYNESGVLVIIEAKGYENDSYPTKRSFLRNLIALSDCMYFEVRTLKELEIAVKRAKKETPSLIHIRRTLIKFCPKETLLPKVLKMLEAGDESLVDLVGKKYTITMTSWLIADLLKQLKDELSKFKSN